MYSCMCINVCVCVCDFPHQSTSCLAVRITGILISVINAKWRIIERRRRRLVHVCVCQYKRRYVCAWAATSKWIESRVKRTDRRWQTRSGSLAAVCRCHNHLAVRLAHWLRSMGGRPLAYPLTIIYRQSQTLPAVLIVIIAQLNNCGNYFNANYNWLYKLYNINFFLPQC